jgi:hypothetical protein
MALDFAQPPVGQNAVQRGQFTSLQPAVGNEIVTWRFLRGAQCGGADECCPDPDPSKGMAAKTEEIVEDKFKNTEGRQRRRSELISTPRPQSIQGRQCHQKQGILKRSLLRQAHHIGSVGITECFEPIAY